MILVFSIHKPDFTQSCGRYCLVLQHQINRINAMMEQTNHSTDTLLASFQAGNMAAFSQLYNLHINVLFNYGLKLTIDKELLKDCIHDIFVKLYTKKDELGTIDNLRSYLFISLKNKLCDELRRRMYMSDTAIEDVNAVAPTDVEDDYMEEEQRKNEFSLVRRLLDQLSPRQREALTLYYIEETFKKYQPQIVIHAAAYKHVPLVEHNILEGITNNIIGTKNTIDLSIKYKVEKFVLISTDKAVRPTNVMGTTKRVCELYAQNVDSKNTEIVAVRFGNVLGSSGSVIPKFKAQIEAGKNITVTHPEITRYFMLIPEACELVLQAASIGKGGEIFILDMGEPIKIVDLAKKMIELSGRSEIGIEFCGLRCGEKLYEELLIDDSDKKTQYESITVASPTFFDIEELNKRIEELLVCEDKISKLKEIVPEFDHRLN